MGCENTDNFVKMIYGGRVLKEDGSIDMNRLEIYLKKQDSSTLKRETRWQTLQAGLIRLSFKNQDQETVLILV
jgi:phage-related protein